MSFNNYNKVMVSSSLYLKKIPEIEDLPNQIIFKILNDTKSLILLLYRYDEHPRSFMYMKDVTLDVFVKILSYSYLFP